MVHPAIASRAAAEEQYSGEAGDEEAEVFAVRGGVAFVKEEWEEKVRDGRGDLVHEFAACGFGAGISDSRPSSQRDQRDAKNGVPTVLVVPANQKPGPFAQLPVLWGRVWV